MDIDFIDIGLGFVGVALVAAAPTPLAAIFWVLVWLIIYGARRAATNAGLKDREIQNKLGKGAQMLLPQKNEDNQQQEIAITQKKPIDVRVVNQPENDLTWFQRITKPIEYDNDPAITAHITTTRGKAVKNVSTDNLAKALKITPTYISHKQVPNPPTKTSVPVGYDVLMKKWVWADFGLDGDVVHSLVAGQSGTGKDAILRLWYTMLTALNSPEEIQFIVLDGKGEWMTTDLLQSKHMFVPPAGGVEMLQNDKGKWYDAANDRMEASIGKVFEEITNRNELFAKANATNITSYYRKTGIKLPILIIIATDVGTNIENQFESLVKILSFKGRSFGIKLIVSMQHVSGQDTGWRGQLGLVMSGFQQAPSSDTPTMGINASRLVFRPSELPTPNPSNVTTLGLFVVRRGTEQTLVKTAHLSEEDWEAYISTALPKVGDDDEIKHLLGSLLTQHFAPTPVKQEIQKVEQRRVILTPAQLQQIRDKAKSGKSKSDIMYEMGFTSGPRYKETSPFVDTIMRKIKENNLEV